MKNIDGFKLEKDKVNGKRKQVFHLFCDTDFEIYNI